MIAGAGFAVATAAEDIPAIVAEPVREPLQKKSVDLQRTRRAQLLAQLNSILPARDTPRGLVVTVPESSQASERVARIAELIPSDVSVRVAGCTDERRARAVRDVLIANDPVPREIAVTGGRANRCVEIVISGQGIGHAVAPRQRM